MEVMGSDVYSEVETTQDSPSLIHPVAIGPALLPFGGSHALGEGP